MEVIYNLNSKGKWIKWLHEDKPLSFSESGRNRRQTTRLRIVGIHLAHEERILMRSCAHGTHAATTVAKSDSNFVCYCRIIRHFGT